MRTDGQMRSKSVWKEKAEEEIFELLAKTFEQKDIQEHPKVNGKRPDFLVKSIRTCVEVCSVRAISDIIRKALHSPLSDDRMQFFFIDKDKKELLDKLAGKILEECEQLPEDTPNVLVVKTEQRYVSPNDVVDVFMEYTPVIRKTSKTVEWTHRNHFRTEEEKLEVLRKISAIIAYSHECEFCHKLRGLYVDNKNNARIPLCEKGEIFEQMTCDANETCKVLKSRRL